MAKKTGAVSTSLQMEIMQIVWDRGEVTVGEVLEAIASRREVARNTIQTTMVRLEDKGWLTHRQVANAFRYSAAIERQTSLGGMVRDLIDGAFKGSVEGLVMTLLQERPLSNAEAERIRQLIEDSRKRR